MTRQEFTSVYNTIGPKVFRLCLGYASGNVELAKEWHQETFIKVWNHRKSFKGDSSIDTWIYRIAVNVCLGDLRQIKRSQPITEEVLHHRGTDDYSVNDEKNIQKMYHCIDQLNGQNRALILLELEDIPQATIADTVGLAYGTLRTRLSRIRKSLLKCITNEK